MYLQAQRKMTIMPIFFHLFSLLMGLTSLLIIVNSISERDIEIYTTIVTKIIMRKIFKISQFFNCLFLFVTYVIISTSDEHSLQGLAMISVLIITYTLFDIFIVFGSEKLNAMSIFMILSHLIANTLIFIHAYTSLVSYIGMGVIIYVIIWGFSSYYILIGVIQYLHQKNNQMERREYINHIPLKQISYNVIPSDWQDVEEKQNA